MGRPRRISSGGRGDVRAVLDVLLAPAAARAILVQGGPGIGKTALTRVVGNHPDVVERFGKANLWFVARAIGADPAKGFGATLARLRGRPGLLVLDNLETPWDPTDERAGTEAALAELAAVPDLSILASFRGHDGVGGTVWALVHPVERLAAPFDAELFEAVAQRDSRKTRICRA